MRELTVLEKRELSTLVPKMLDSLTVSTSRGTAVNTAAEQEAAAEQIHNAMVTVDRGIYAMLSALPGVLDSGKQRAVIILLRKAFSIGGCLTAEEEKTIINYITSSLPPQRRFKLFGMLKKHRINNARTRGLILRSILEDEKLPFHAVKYRKKLRAAIQHTIGVRRASIAKSILAKIGDNVRNLSETEIIRDLFGDVSNEVLESVSFILGNEMRFSIPILNKYIAAKTSLSAGKGLPLTTLDGLRRTFHPGTPRSFVFELAEEAMTTRERAQTQTAQKRADVRKITEFDPEKLDLHELVIYAYEKGLESVHEAIQKKAKEAYRAFPFKYDKIGIILDASQSMIGHRTQPMRPMAMAWETWQVLKNAPTVETIIIGGKTKNGLLLPEGHTDLATPLLAMADKAVDAVFVLSDGYENALGGRFDEVISLLRKIGWNTPVYQLSSVMSAETGGTRELSKAITSLAMNDLRTIGIQTIKQVFSVDPQLGLKMLEDATIKQLTPGGLQ